MTRKGWLAGIVAVGLAAALLPSVSHTMTISREEALAGLETTRVRILANVDANTSEAANELIFFVVRPIQYHPKVMQLCDELIAKSSTTAGLELSLSALDMLAKSSSASLRKHGELPRVERIVERGLKSNDTMLKLLAARVLTALGPDYAGRRMDAYRRVFYGPPIQIESGLRAFAADDIRFEMVGVMRELLPRAKSDKQVRSIVRAGTEKYNLLAFFRSRIENAGQPGTVEERFRIFEEWQRLMKQEK